MTPLDTKQLEQKLTAQDWDGAKQVLRDFFDQEMTPQERGEAYVAAAELYLQVNNAIDKQYSEELASAIKNLQQLDQSEKKLDDAGGLIDARKAIKNS